MLGEEPLDSMEVEDGQVQPVENLLRVQELFEKGITQIPRTFIRPVEERHSPGAVDCSRTIPVVDLAGVEDDFRVRDRLRREVGQACADWGFFQVVNHGVPFTLLEQIMRVGAGFFALPAEKKLLYACHSESFAGEGYGNRMLVQEDQVLDWRDYVDHHTLPLSRRCENKWPDKPAHYRETIVQYSDQTRLLAVNLLALISESLGLPSSAVLDAIGEPVQNVSVNYYPACPQPDLTLGLQSHSDFGAITLLIQDDVGGLQVSKGGQWVAVPPIPHAFVVNLGDQMQILSNDRFCSVEHRAVVNATKARMSVATFYDPSRERKIAPLAQLVAQGQRPHYREIVFGDHVTAWYSKGPYGKKNLASLAVAGGR
eukprot:TRINITY_DN11906_c0_g1_i1.p1 TRINITY_DN11906_c0_g1~~TRINITY_DN11906_c0_g1_i1.p1  ORF type:complete len:370 (+),score=62.76 TRINITY_DN11906_c0_g1_i1:231-1340(+)